jgi:hypothetical protein
LATTPVGDELTRLVRRWHELPLDQALSYAGQVRALAQHLADRVADLSGRSRQPLPDLGPAVVMDQLSVMVYDALEAGLPELGEPLAESLAALRRTLAPTLGPR